MYVCIHEYLDFDKTQLKPGDKGYVYDKQEVFETDPTEVAYSIALIYPILSIYIYDDDDDDDSTY